MLGWIPPKCSCKQLWQPDKDVLFVRVILWKISVTEREGTWQVVSKEKTRDPWLNVRFLPIKNPQSGFLKKKKKGGSRLTFSDAVLRWGAYRSAPQPVHRGRHLISHSLIIFAVSLTLSGAVNYIKITSRNDGVQMSDSLNAAQN